MSYEIYVIYNIALFVNSERRLAKSRVDLTLCQHGKFPATLLLKFFVLYYKRNIKHFIRNDIVILTFVEIKDFTDAQAFFVSACEQATSRNVKFVN